MKLSFSNFEFKDNIKYDANYANHAENESTLLLKHIHLLILFMCFINLVFQVQMAHNI